jgi:hypothetical protein
MVNIAEDYQSTTARSELQEVLHLHLHKFGASLPHLPTQVGSPMFCPLQSPVHPERTRHIFLRHSGSLSSPQLHFQDNIGRSKATFPSWSQFVVVVSFALVLKLLSEYMVGLVISHDTITLPWSAAALRGGITEDGNRVIRFGA